MYDSRASRALPWKHQFWSLVEELERTLPLTPTSVLSTLSYSHLSMSSTREETSALRKRKRPILDDLESQPLKRLKPCTRLHSAISYASISKVWLTRRALRELERQTSPISYPLPTFVRQQKVNRKQIQRFARHGGPELHDLRGVL